MRLAIAIIVYGSMCAFGLRQIYRELKWRLAIRRTTKALNASFDALSLSAAKLEAHVSKLSSKP